MTADEWVAAALAAAVEQIGSLAIEEDEALDAIASQMFAPEY